MKVFISWSGDRSQLLARALRDWLPLVLHYVEPWLSDADIAAGARWADAVAKELEASNFGIICVTRENAGTEWVLFEAGALAKSMQESRVIPLLLDLEFREISGPLAQFQAKKVEKSGVSETVHSINNAASQPVSEMRARQLFEALWPQLEHAVAEIPKQPPAARHTRPQPQVLEELVASVRALDSRFREVSDEGPRRVRTRRSKVHPMMWRELVERSGIAPGDPVTLLIMLSPLREDAPWLYELGVDAYHALRIGPSEESDGQIRRLVLLLETLLRGPFGEELGIDPRWMHSIYLELRRFVSRETHEGETGFGLMRKSGMKDEERRD